MCQGETSIPGWIDAGLRTCPSPFHLDHLSIGVLLLMKSIHTHIPRPIVWSGSVNLIRHLFFPVARSLVGLGHQNLYLRQAQPASQDELHFAKAHVPHLMHAVVFQQCLPVLSRGP